jgi:hypothetical protein
MAGKIIADQIEHSTAGSLDTSYVVNGSAKAWGKFSTGFTSVLDSLNISSLDDDGTGNGGANFSSAFANANYSTAQNVVWAIGTGNQVRTVAGDSQATSSFEFSTGYVDGSGQWTYYDADIQPSVQINGDLA